MIDAVSKYYGKSPSVHIVYVTPNTDLTLLRSDGTEIQTSALKVDVPESGFVAQLRMLMEDLPKSRLFRHSVVKVPGREDIHVSQYLCVMPLVIAAGRCTEGRKFL